MQDMLAQSPGYQSLNRADRCPKGKARAGPRVADHGKEAVRPYPRSGSRKPFSRLPDGYCLVNIFTPPNQSFVRLLKLSAALLFLPASFPALFLDTDRYAFVK